MPIIKTNHAKAVRSLKKFDWSTLDALTDKQIARQIKQNADSVPDISADLKSGSFNKPIKPEHIKAVRHKTGLSQAGFAERLHLNVATIRNWEQGRTYPDGAAITLLAVIDRMPQVIMQILE